MKSLKFFLFAILSSTAISLHSVEQQLIIVRHGEAGNNIEKVYNSNPENPGYKPANLTPNGKLAVQKTAKKLRAQGFNNNNIAAILISPLPRAKQTADILIQQGLGTRDKIIVDKRLIETNAGDLEGKPTFAVWEPYFAREYHAESEEQVKKRIKDFYDSIIRQYPQGNIIVITHGLPSQDLIQLVSHQIVKLGLGEAKVIPFKS